MNSLQSGANPPELHHVIPNDARKGAGELGACQVPPRPGLPQPLVYGLERWLAGFNQPEKEVVSGPSPSAPWHAGIANLIGEPLPAQAATARSHRMPPPPKLPGSLQAAEADDAGWTPTVLDFYVGANQVVVRCHVCPYSGAVRDLRVELLPLSS